VSVADGVSEGVLEVEVDCEGVMVGVKEALSEAVGVLAAVGWADSVLEGVRVSLED
jgi:hypothetical protein